MSAQNDDTYTLDFTQDRLLQRVSGPLSSRRGLKEMIFFHLVLYSRMTGAIILLPPHALNECTLTPLPFSFQQ